MEMKDLNFSPYYTNVDSFVDLISVNSNDSNNNDYLNVEENIINNNSIFENIRENIGIDEDNQEMLNKKRKTKTAGKFRGDNLQRKCKHLVIESAIEFINKKISNAYKGDIGSGLVRKELLKLKQDQKKDSHVDFNKKFIHMSLKDILSQNLTPKIKYYPKEHNKNLINELINEKREIFENIFNISFIECLEHFVGIKSLEQLNGLKLFSDLKEEIIKKEDGNYYYKNLEIFLKNYEAIINNAKPRKSKKN